MRAADIMPAIIMRADAFFDAAFSFCYFIIRGAMLWWYDGDVDMLMRCFLFLLYKEYFRFLRDITRDSARVFSSSGAILPRYESFFRRYDMMPYMLFYFCLREAKIYERDIWCRLLSSRSFRYYYDMIRDIFMPRKILYIYIIIIIKPYYYMLICRRRHFLPSSYARCAMPLLLLTRKR